MPGSVLVIDDKPHAAGFAAMLGAQGIAVETAPSASRGLERAKRGGVDLVILDLLAGGAAALATIRRTLPDQAVLVLSPRSDVDSRARFLESGASDYLARPFAPAELLARVRIQLRRPRAARRRDDAVADAPRSASAVGVARAADG